jgi:SAM-dependent methyltransferase
MAPPGLGAWDARYAAQAPYHGPAPAPSFSSSLPGDARVLDLGCGAGKSLAALRAAGPAWHLVGLDASRPGLRRAPREVLVQGDASRLPLRPACVDAVRIDFLLGHLDPASRGAAAVEVERVLRPGGWLEVHEFARGDLRDGAGTPGREAHTWTRDGVPTHYFEPGELAALFPRCPGAAEVRERAVRFSPRPRRIVALRARRA